MKRSKFSEAQVSFILRQVDEGATVGECPPSAPMRQIEGSV